MNNAAAALLAFLSGLILNGCATADRVVFVTLTQLDIGYDASSGTANIGYNRDENVLGPAYPASGGVPPVYARMESSGNLLTPRVKQVYASGDAAKRVTAEAECDAPPRHKPLSGNRRLMVFGTSTNFGFKVQFVTNVPESVNFGFKRKELSWVPLRKKSSDFANDEDEYASLIARIGIGTDFQSTRKSANYEIDQFIATGEAADSLACSNEVRESFKNETKEAMASAKRASANVGAIPGFPLAD